MATVLPLLVISPPLINSSNPWATTLDDLRALHACSSTGAVTTRTSLIDGFAHDPKRHVYQFFSASAHESSSTPDGSQNASLNSLGYSPILLDAYLEFIKVISDELPSPSSKGFIVSVTGTPEQITECYKRIATTQSSVRFPLAMEVNLSCPNIPNKPPPAYSEDALVPYLDGIQDVINSDVSLPRIPFGLKTPPYTHSTEYEALFRALERSASRSPVGLSPVSFITATNTLGSCLLLAPVPGADPRDSPPFVSTLPGAGIGGMAGAPLRALLIPSSRQSADKKWCRPSCPRQRADLAKNALRTQRPARAYFHHRHRRSFGCRRVPTYEIGWSRRGRCRDGPRPERGGHFWRD